MLHVNGGPAGSGTKRPKHTPAPDWTCTVCKRDNRGYCVNCANCYARRP